MKAVSSSLAVLALILLILLIRCCNERTRLQGELENQAAAPAPAEDAGDPHLVIEHADAGDWINFSNTFSIEGCDAAVTPTAYWPGILFQLGTHNFQTDFKFEEIQIFSGGSSTPDVYKDWTWINIVSRAPTRISPPIAPDEALGLYPNNGLASSCGDIDPFKAGGCERNRTISASMEVVRSLITYWQGPAGYELTAVQTEGDCTGSEFRFTFLDDFQVEVYLPPDPYNDTVMPAPARIYDVGAVDLIKVVVAGYGPDLGQTQPPPWPYP